MYSTLRSCLIPCLLCFLVTTGLIGWSYGQDQPPAAANTEVGAPRPIPAGDETPSSSAEETPRAEQPPAVDEPSAYDGSPKPSGNAAEEAPGGAPQEAAPNASEETPTDPAEDAPGEAAGESSGSATDEPGQPVEATEGDALLAGHSQHGEAFNEGPRQSAYLMDGTGNIHFPVTSVSHEAVKLVEQGMGQLHGFWYFEAERSFRQAAAFDPRCAIAYWGMAMANTGNEKRAKQFMAKAVERKEGASDLERRLIEADEQYLNSKDKRDDKVKQYVSALEEIVKAYPEVLEARAYWVYALYRFRGELKKDYEEVDQAIQQVLDAEPLHPVHHYRIHLWDYKDASRALQSSALCGQSSPSIAHMWHMPGHIYSRLKRYEDAVWQQEASARVDHAHMMRDRVMPDQIHNFAHNNEWLIRNLVFIGRWRDAVDLAKNMTELPQHPKYNTLSKRGSAYYGRQRLFSVLDDYEIWDELIELCDQPYLEPTDNSTEQLKRLRHLGVALVQAERLDDGRAILQQLQAKADELEKADQQKQENQESSRGKKRRRSNSELTQTQKAIAAIEGYLAAAAGEYERAVELLNKADEDNGRIARLQCRAGKTDEAIELARKQVKGKDNEVLPLAALAEVLSLAGKQEEAKQAFESLRAISSSIQFGSPVFDRLAPLAASCGFDADWRLPPHVADDVGTRPSLDSLGPFRWQPTPAPEWVLQDTSGTSFALKSYQGKPVVVIFYLGYGCLHCAQQLQAFAPATEKFSQAGISLIAISTDSPQDLKISVDNYPGGMPFPLVSDHDLDVFKAYRVFDDFENAPLHGTFVIDGDGLVRWQDVSYEPFMDPEFVLREAQRLLAQGPPPTILHKPVIPEVESAAPVENDLAVVTSALREIRAGGIDGALLLNGQGTVPQQSLQRFIDLAKREQARLLILLGSSTQSEAPSDTIARLIQQWQEQQGTSVQILRVDSSGLDDQQLSTITGATGIWCEAGDRGLWRSVLNDTSLGEACRQLLARGGVIGGSADFSAVVSESFFADPGAECLGSSTGLGWLPDVIVDLDSSDQAGSRLQSALSAHPRALGIHIPADSTLVIRGRRMQVIGAGPVQIHYASSTAYPDQTGELREGSRMVDYTAMRRYAVVRTGSLFPPVQPAQPRVEQGTLIIIGGGGIPRGLLERFVQLAGGDKSSIVVIPISMPEPLSRRQSMEDVLRRAGAAEVTVLTGRTPEAVCSPESLAALRKATGIWFGGGRQWRFMDAYEGTEAAELMHEVLRRGGVIAGSSAGASVQGDYMARGNPLGSGPIMADGYERGLRFLKGVAIDQHFSQRQRFADLGSLVDRYPQLLGIGIDESTALVVHGSVAEVVGRNRVCFYDRSKPVEEGTPDYTSVAGGGKYDLVLRQVLADAQSTSPDESQATTAEQP